MHPAISVCGTSPYLALRQVLRRFADFPLAHNYALCINSALYIVLELTERTSIYNSHGIPLVEHEEFESREQAIISGSDINSRTLLQDFTGCRMRIKDTDLGKELLQQVEDLKQLLAAYQSGSIKEKE